LGDRFGQGQALGGLAATYSALGNYEKAIDYYQKSLNIARGVSNPKWQGTTLRNLGIAYLSQGDYTQAIKYQEQREQSLAIAKSMQDRQGEGQALGNLGIAYFSQGNYPKAIYYQEQHLRLARQLQYLAGEGRALGNLGLAYYGLKNYRSSAEYHQQYLAIARELHDRAGEGQALSNLGDALLQSGNLLETEETLFDAIKVWESLRAELGSNDLNKVSIFETQSTTYTTLQEALIAQNKIQAALEIAERGRARAFVELLERRLSLVASSNLVPVETVKPPEISQIQQIAKDQNATIVEYSIVRNAFQVEGKREIQESKLYIWTIQPTGEIAFRRADLKPLWQQQNTSLSGLVSNSRVALGARDVVRQWLPIYRSDLAGLVKRKTKIYSNSINYSSNQLPTFCQKIHLPALFLFLKNPYFWFLSQLCEMAMANILSKNTPS
jgi:tetratricopeptide (TPR) repeat protein